MSFQIKEDLNEWSFRAKSERAGYHERATIASVRLGLALFSFQWNRITSLAELVGSIYLSDILFGLAATKDSRLGPGLPPLVPNFGTGKYICFAQINMSPDADIRRDLSSFFVFLLVCAYLPLAR